jgi:hypothetical protein
MTGHAPAQLPFAPKPLKDELFSSWLLRVAVENAVSGRELLSGFASVHPHIPLPRSLDRSLNQDFLRAFSHFTRVHFHTLKALDLESRLQRSHRAVLLCFPSTSKPSPRCCDLRAGYAFCPLCIAQHSVIHVRWDWCFAGLIRCSVHDSLLRLGCPACGEADPLSFDTTFTNASRACQSCSTDLTLQTSPLSKASLKNISAIDQAYRDALMSVAPNSTLLGQTSDEQFQSCIDDILEFLARKRSWQHKTLATAQQNGSISDQPRLLAILDVIMNAAPSADRQTRSNCHRRSLKLWARIFSSAPESDIYALKRSSRRWPAAIRARFDHPWSRRERDALRWRTDFSLPTVSDLSAATSRKSSI